MARAADDQAARPLGEGGGDLAHLGDGPRFQVTDCGLVAHRRQRFRGRSERLAERRVQVDGSVLPQRAGDGRAQVRKRQRIRQTQLGEPGVCAEEAVLIELLRGAPAVQLRRAVGGDRDQRHPRRLRFEQGRIEMSSCAARSAEDCDGPPGSFRRAQGEEGRAALVDDGVRPQPLGEREREGSAAGSGADHRVADAAARQLVRHRRGPEQVEVHGRAPRASSSARAFSSVSSHSASGEDPSTMPAPTKIRARRPRMRADRSATASSARPSPTQPTTPA